MSFEDLRIRAEAGDKTATRQLAEAYYLGREGVEQNFAEAARWYLKLAQQGDVRAQTTIDLMYSRGYGGEKDPQAAHRWWSFAAAANDPGAQYNLGLSYAKGDGVAQDYAQAVQWYSKAAQRTHVQAQFNLGMLITTARVAHGPGGMLGQVAALQETDLRRKAGKDRRRMSPSKPQAEGRTAEWKAEKASVGADVYGLPARRPQRARSGDGATELHNQRKPPAD